MRRVNDDDSHMGAPPAELDETTGPTAAALDHEASVLVVLSRLRAAVLDLEGLTTFVHGASSSTTSTGGAPLAVPFMAGDDTLRFARTSIGSAAGGVPHASPGRGGLGATAAAAASARNLVLQLVESHLLTELLHVIQGEPQTANAAATMVASVHIRVDAVFTWLLCTQLLLRPETKTLLQDGAPSDVGRALGTQGSASPKPLDHRRFSKSKKHGTKRTTNVSEEEGEEEGRGAASLASGAGAGGGPSGYRSFCAMARLHTLDVLEGACHTLRALILDADEAEAMGGDADDDAPRPSRQRMIWLLFCSLRIALGCHTVAHWELDPETFHGDNGSCDDGDDAFAPRSAAHIGGCPCFRNIAAQRKSCKTHMSSNPDVSPVTAVLDALMASNLLGVLVDYLSEACGGSDDDSSPSSDDGMEASPFGHWVACLTLVVMEQVFSTADNEALDLFVDAVAKHLRRHDEGSTPETVRPSSSHALLVCILERCATSTSCVGVSGTLQSLAARVLTLWVLRYACTAGADGANTLAEETLGDGLGPRHAALLSENLLRGVMHRLADVVTAENCRQEAVSAQQLHDRNRRNDAVEVDGMAATYTSEVRWVVGRGDEAIEKLRVPRRERHGGGPLLASLTPAAAASGRHPASSGPPSASSVSSVSHMTTAPEAVLFLALLHVAPSLWTAQVAGAYSSRSMMGHRLFPMWMADAAAVLSPWIHPGGGGGTPGAVSSAVLVATPQFTVTAVDAPPVALVPGPTSVVCFSIPSVASTPTAAGANHAGGLATSSPLVFLHTPTNTTRFRANPSVTLRFATEYQHHHHAAALPEQQLLPPCAAVVCRLRDEAAVPNAPPVAVVSRVLSEWHNELNQSWSTGIGVIDTCSNSTTTTATQASAPASGASSSTTTAVGLQFDLLGDSPLIAQRLRRRAVELFLVANDEAAVSVGHTVGPLIHRGSTAGARTAAATVPTFTIATCAMHVSETSVWVDHRLAAQDAAVVRTMPSSPPRRCNAKPLWLDEAPFVYSRVLQQVSIGVASLRGGGGGLRNATSTTASRSMSATKGRGASAQEEVQQEQGSEPSPSAPRGAAVPQGDDDSHTRSSPSDQEATPVSPGPPLGEAAAPHADDRPQEHTQATVEDTLARKEVLELRTALALQNTRYEALYARFEASEVQRGTLAQRLADVRVELELYQSSMVTPLREEASRLRQDLIVKERDLHYALAAMHTLAAHNEALTKQLVDVAHSMEMRIGGGAS